MDAVREIAVMFCGAAVLSATVSVLAPSAFNSSSKYVTALIMLGVLVTGIAKGDFSIDFSTSQDSLETMSETETELCEYQAEYLIAQLLDERGVEYRNITAVATKSESDSIIISEIRVEGTDDKAGVKDALVKAGIDCRVVFE